MTSSLIVFFRSCKSFLEWIPAQCPLETPESIDGGPSKNQVSTRYFYVVKKILIKVLMSFYEDRESGGEENVEVKEEEEEMCLCIRT